MKEHLLTHPAYSCRSQDANALIDNLKNNQLKFYQFYNTEISPNEQSFFKYLHEFGDIDSKYWDSKRMNKTYYDIETKFDPEKAPDSKIVEFPITSIALYNNILNKAIILYLKDPEKHKSLEQKSFKNSIINMYQDICKENITYDIPDIEIEVELINTEAKLIQRFFTLVKEIDTLFLIGFNSNMFDDPYTINRAFKLFNSTAESYITDFTLKRYGDYNFEQADYMRLDLLRFYKPVDAGGMGMGKSLPSYKLDYIAETELKINKLDIHGDFNKIYEDDPVTFATYNLLDTLLTFKLDQKLQFIEQLYSLAKYNNASVRGTITGRSFIFNYRNTYHYIKDENLLVRNNKLNKELYYEPEFEV